MFHFEKRSSYKIIVWLDGRMIGYMLQVPFSDKWNFYPIFDHVKMMEEFKCFLSGLANEP